MNDRDNVIKKLTNLPTTIYCGFYQLRITHDLRDKVIAMLKEQQAEIERLKKENEEVKNRVHIMYNRCICFRCSDNCDDCVQREKCESTRHMWRGWHLKDRERVKDGEQE